MAQSADKSKNFAARIISNIRQGDRVIWIITLLLMMFSLMAIFSATSSKAILGHISRVNIFGGQVKIVGAGLLLILCCCAFSSLKVFRKLSRWGFVFSLALLSLMLFMQATGKSIGPMSVTRTNSAIRAISIGGFSLQVYEVVKVAMVMYLSWAIQTYESGSFKVTNALGDKFPSACGWMKSACAQRWIYIFIPVLMAPALILIGSTGSAMLVLATSLATLLIGGMKWKDLLAAGGISVLCLGIMIGVHIVSSGTMVKRFQTAANRFGIELPYPDAKAREDQKKLIHKREAKLDEIEYKSAEFYEYLDKHRQPEAAEIAFVEGGRLPIGKGPGKSTQKYIVPVMYEDYMFDFLVEEYGLTISMLVMILYISLFARCVLIVQHCSNRYAKACVGGLGFLITGQALLHIIVNCNIGLLTGQTLPLISYGRCSFLCFSIALGVILSISTMANKKLQKQQKEEQRLLLEDKDDISAGLSILESIDEEFEQQAENAVTEPNQEI